MPIKSIQIKTDRSPEEIARLKSLRERLQKDKPGLAEMPADATVPLGVYLETRELLLRLKQEREHAGLSLADVAERTGMDRAAISRLENGHQTNPTIETLSRYARALGKSIVYSFVNVEKT